MKNILSLFLMAIIIGLPFTAFAMVPNDPDSKIPDADINPQNYAEAKEGLDRRGYFATSNMADYLSPETLTGLSHLFDAELKPCFSDSSDKLYKKSLHTFAKEAGWQIAVINDPPNPCMMEWLSVTGPFNRIPPELERLIKDVFAYLPKGAFHLEVFLRDDFAMIKPEDEPRLYEINDTPFHLDRLEVERSVVDWLFFVLVKAEGIINNNALRLGTTSRADINWQAKYTIFTKDQGSVKTIINLEGKSGAGYFIKQSHAQPDQDAVIVHGLSGLKFVVPDEEDYFGDQRDVEQNQSFLQGCDLTKIAKPCRRKIILRILAVEESP